MSESLFDMVRGDPAHADLPVVIISDTPEKADASLRARQAEHVLLIPKPFTGAQVARALDQLLAPVRSPITANYPITRLPITSMPYAAVEHGRLAVPRAPGRHRSEGATVVGRD